MKKNWVYGYHASKSVLTERPHNIVKCFFSKKLEYSKKHLELIDNINKHNLSIDYIKDEKLTKILGIKNHQGIALKVLSSNGTSLDYIIKSGKNKERLLLLILEEIQDPHNLGSCFRNAYAAGFNGIIFTIHNTCDITPTVMKVASGAYEKIPFARCNNVSSVIRELKKQNILTIGLAINDKTINFYDVDTANTDIAIILGNESNGLKTNTLNQCDIVCKIPMIEPNFSLNVAATSAIACFELAKRTGKI